MPSSAAKTAEPGWPRYRYQIRPSQRCPSYLTISRQPPIMADGHYQPAIGLHDISPSGYFHNSFTTAKLRRYHHAMPTLPSRRQQLYGVIEAAHCDIRRHGAFNAAATQSRKKRISLIISRSNAFLGRSSPAPSTLA